MDKPHWTERRRANKIARIQEDLQISLDEATEHYYKSFREIASRGGKNSPNRPFRDIPGLAKRAADKSAKKRKK